MAVERLALLAASAALVEGAPSQVADGFARARLDGQRGAAYGTADIDPREVTQILERALPSA